MYLGKNPQNTGANLTAKKESIMANYPPDTALHTPPGD